MQNELDYTGYITVGCGTVVQVILKVEDLKRKKEKGRLLVSLLNSFFYLSVHIKIKPGEMTLKTLKFNKRAANAN